MFILQANKLELFSYTVQEMLAVRFLYQLNNPMIFKENNFSIVLKYQMIYLIFLQEAFKEYEKLTKKTVMTIFQHKVKWQLLNLLSIKEPHKEEDNRRKMNETGDYMISLIIIYIFLIGTNKFLQHG